MPDIALLIAGSFQDAIKSAKDWGWEITADVLYLEFRRPDTGQLVRYHQDQSIHSTKGLRWHTVVYLGDNWMKRKDVDALRELGFRREDGSIESGQGFFTEGDPTLPPPRPKRPRDRELDALIKQHIRQHGLD